MSAHLVGVSALGGVPLFSRHVGLPHSEQASSFATLAALNGVNLFSRLNDANLEATATKSAKIRWKVFHGNIVLILVANASDEGGVITDKCVEHMLDMVFEALVMCCGLDELCGQNIERMKRSLKTSYPLVDHLLGQLISREAHMNILTRCVSYVYMDTTYAGEFMHGLIESFAQLAQSDFACVLLAGKLLTATKGWWSRISHTRDAASVIAMANCITPALESEMHHIKELSIFLPENCPNSITRLIVAQVFPEIVLVALCGESPPLDTITSEAINVIKESDVHQDHFQKVQMLRNGSTIPVIHDQILAIVMVKGDVRSLLRYGNFDENKLRDMLLMVDVGAGASQDEFAPLSKPQESYVKFQQYHGYRIAHDNNQLYILFPFVLSVTVIREISLQTFTLFKDKKLWPRVS